MFDNITKFFKKLKKSEKEESKNTAKERLHLVLAQDRANISADFLEMMKQEIIEVIKKYIDIDEKAIDVRLTNKESEDGVMGAPALYANIPIITIKNEARQLEGSLKEKEMVSEVKKLNNEDENDNNNDNIENRDNNTYNEDNIEKENTNSNNSNEKNTENNIENNDNKIENVQNNNSSNLNVDEEANKDEKETEKQEQKKNNENNLDEVKDEKKDS